MKDKVCNVCDNFITDRKILLEKFYWKNIIDENERWLDETSGDRSKLKMFHNCEFKPVSIKSEKENEEILKTFPPYPLHKDILGPGNDCLEKMEYHWDDAMTVFYKKQRIGDKFNVADIKFIMKDLHLHQISNKLPVEAEPFIN